MAYTVTVLRAAQKVIDDLDKTTCQRILEALKKLSANPRPPGCEKMQGEPGWRIRVRK